VKFLPGLLLACVLQGALGHELAQNRATLVLRDPTHVSMTLYLGYAEALHRLAAPQQRYEDFVAAHAAMPPQAFRRLLSNAQSRWQDETRLLAPDGQAIAVERWTWPDPDRVQALLRERTMQAVVAPGVHAHEPVIEIRAEFRATRPVRALRAQFPAAFQRVLLVWYRPSQAWVEPQRLSPEVRF